MDADTLNSSQPRPQPKRENMLVNLAFNILLPSLILAKLSGPEWLGPQLALVVALAFPLGYGIWDFGQRRTANFVSILGFVSTLATGGLGLMAVDGIWFAVKEATVPALIGLVLWASIGSKRPLVRQFLFNDQVIDVERVDTELAARNNQQAFELLLRNASYLLVASFAFSAVLNFILARWLLVSPAGSEAFNAELAQMNLLSWPIIALPSMAISMFALWRLIKGVSALSGLPLEQIFHPQQGK